MKIAFLNYWEGNSFKDGRYFRIHFIDIYADLHSSYRYFEITILNLGISMSFPGRIK